MTKEDDDLRDVLRQERSRGRKQRVDIEGEREQKRRQKVLLETARYGTEQRFREVLRELGFSQEEIEEKIKAFRAFRAGL